MPRPQAGWIVEDHMGTLPQACHQPSNHRELQQTSHDELLSSVRWQGLPCSAPAFVHSSHVSSP